MNPGMDLCEAFRDCFQISLLADFLNHPTFDRILLISCYFGVFIAVVSLLIEMGQIVLKGEGSYIDIILKIFIAIFLLTSFSSWAIGVVEFSDGFAQSFLDTSLLNNYSEYTEQKTGSDAYAKYAKDYDNISFSFISRKKNAQSIEKILVNVSVWLTKAVMFIIAIIRNVSLTVILLIGPLLVVTIPNKYLSPYGWGWIKSYFNVVSWPLVVALLLFILNITLDKFLMASGDTLLMIKLFSYNIVFIFMLIKAMTFLPSLKQGTAGALSAIEGLMAAGMAAAGLAGASKMTSGMKSNVSSDKSTGSNNASDIAKAGLTGFANSTSDRIPQSRVPSAHPTSSDNQTISSAVGASGVDGNAMGAANSMPDNTFPGNGGVVDSTGSHDGNNSVPDNSNSSYSELSDSYATNGKGMPVGYVPNAAERLKVEDDIITPTNNTIHEDDNSHKTNDKVDLTNKTTKISPKEGFKIFKGALSDGFASMKAETEKKYPTTYAFAKLGKRLLFK